MEAISQYPWWFENKNVEEYKIYSNPNQIQYLIDIREIGSLLLVSFSNVCSLWISRLLTLHGNIHVLSIFSVIFQLSIPRIVYAKVKRIDVRDFSINYSQNSIYVGMNEKGQSIHFKLLLI